MLFLIKGHLTVEFYNVIEEKKKTINFDEKGICDACNFANYKNNNVDQIREHQLITLLDKFQSRNNSYDILVPGSWRKRLDLCITYS